jgi:transcriptional regulator with XRE-family HTH domain
MLLSSRQQNISPVSKLFSTRLSALLSAAPRGTAARLARAAGVQTSYISALTGGQKHNPSAEVVHSIARELGVDPHWLLTGEGDSALSSDHQNISGHSPELHQSAHFGARLQETHDTTLDLERYMLLITAALAYYQASPAVRRSSIVAHAHADLDQLFAAASSGIQSTRTRYT